MTPPKRLPTNRDVYRPKHRSESEPSGVPETIFDEPTGVGGDARVFHALKALNRKLEESTSDAQDANAALSEKVDALDSKVDVVAANHAELAGFVRGQTAERAVARSHPLSKELRVAVKETLVETSLAEQREQQKFSREMKLKIVGGLIAALTSGVFLHWLLGGSHG